MSAPAITEPLVDGALLGAIRDHFASLGISFETKSEGKQESILLHRLVDEGWTIGIKGTMAGVAVAITRGEQYADGSGRSIFLAAARAMLQSLAVQQ